ncbi:MAG TPA: hypothetical protein VM364_06500 [Vicinamibacterales bacterium]|nr:hypothetical protein [Vicinamibacterales bacterium]
MGAAVLHAVGAALLLGAVMTTGDFVWEYFGVRHSVVNGLVHGALMCLCIGAVIGARTGRFVPGLLAGPAIGVLAAATFYLLARPFRWGALLPAWMLFWICFALLQRWLASGTLRDALARGVAAAVLSGLAFYAISGIWTNPRPGGPNYAIHFLYWSFAFLPGFLALFVGTTPERRR